MLVECADEFLDLRFVTAERFVGVGPGGEIVPAGAAGGFWIRRDHLDAFLHEVTPVEDALRIALADEEDDGRGVRCRVVRELAAPVLGKQPGVGDLVDVALERERHDIGGKAIDDGARLRTGAAMRLLDGDGFAGFLLPIRDERFVVSFVELARWIVGDVEKGGVSRRGSGQRNG